MKILVALAVCVGLLVLPRIAYADDCPPGVECVVGTSPNSFVGGINTENEGHLSGGPAEPGSTVVSPTDLVGEGLDALCVTTAIESAEDPVEFCGLDEDGEPPELTPGMIAAAFGTIKPPPAQLLIQPPNGRTLVNFETNFYTDAQPFEASLSLLGHQIAFRIRPATFTWNYGDGAAESTETPGAAYPELEITHAYQQKGTVAPSVDTTYAATYRVDGQGPWLDVPGTVTVAGAAASLEVLTATPVLVGYDG